MEIETVVHYALRLVAAIVGFVILRWVYVSMPTTLGHRELRYSSRLRTTAIVAVFLSIGIAYAATFAKESEVIIAYGMAIVTFLAGVGLILETFTRVVRYDETFLYDRSIWRRGERRMAWNELDEYDYSQTNQWHIFRTVERKTIRVSGLLSGHDEFLDFLTRKFREIGITDS